MRASIKHVFAQPLEKELLEKREPLEDGRGYEYTAAELYDIFLPEFALLVTDDFILIRMCDDYCCLGLAASGVSVETFVSRMRIFYQMASSSSSSNSSSK
jgi:hypothetical protein